MIPSHAGLRPRISIRVWPITSSHSTESLGAAQQCISDTDVHRLGAKLWTPAWEGIEFAQPRQPVPLSLINIPSAFQNKHTAPHRHTDPATATSDSKTTTTATPRPTAQIQ